mmetsp:Transcript_36124/g.84408  ORF Transcript_36124/g.84408 Transcript_36124/m.84408 type:complete len:415 (-) Transcript_36124:1534-2778(-)
MKLSFGAASIAPLSISWCTTILLPLSTAFSSAVVPQKRIHQRDKSESCRRIPFLFTPRGGGLESSDDLGSSLKASNSVVILESVSRENLSLLSERGRVALENLVDFDVDGHQSHVYGDWPDAGTEDNGKCALAEQLADLDTSYPGGLRAYLSKSQALLAEAASGASPFEDYVASVPSGEVISYEAESSFPGGLSFLEAENIGLSSIGDVAFVLVAGGLGERLGFSGIKLGLETNIMTNRCFLEVYCNYIKAMQRMSEARGHRSPTNIPLVIMTSGDTDARTRELLTDNNYFGMAPDQIRIVCQDKVPALKNANAGLSMVNRWKVETKPHGHGDVHHLLFREGIVDEWEKEGRTHIIFLQDTNALVINGVSFFSILYLCYSASFSSVVVDIQHYIIYLYLRFYRRLGLVSRGAFI